MPFGEMVNTVLVIGFGSVSLIIGLFFPEAVTKFRDRETEGVEVDSEVEKHQVSINIAILYATLTLVISSIVTEWPPEGQATHPILAHMVFFGSIAVTAFIAGRVLRLLGRLEPGAVQ